ncbi:MAG: hypothetical protein IJT98_10285 [Prevotella sp.]|nr:hypothetical protein [Prevotella sp.]
MSDLLANRLDRLEQLMLEKLGNAGPSAAVAAPAADLQMLNEQIIAMNGLADEGDEATGNRLMSLLLLSAYLRRDQETVDILSREILKGLYGKKAAATEDEAFLFLSLFMVSRNPNYRIAGKRYVRQHPDIPPSLYRLMKLAKVVKVRLKSARTMDSLQQQRLMTEAAGRDIFVVHPSEMLTCCTTDGCQQYLLTTVEKAVTQPLTYKQMKDSRRPAYRPQPSHDTWRLRILGGIALARLDRQYLMDTFRMLEARFESAVGQGKQQSSQYDLQSPLAILEAMYHVAGCDGNVLMESLKQRCDRYFDLHFKKLHVPSGAFADELEGEALAYRLLFFRCLPVVGAHSCHTSPKNRNWLSTLHRWADRLVEQGAKCWQGLPLTAIFRLQRYILQTGFKRVALGSDQKASAYRNHVNSTFFDSYLQLIKENAPAPQALVSCYEMLREWKYDMAANEERYTEYMRVVSQRQKAFTPDSLEWLQLEEIIVDYASTRQRGHTGKLVCKM